jgi:molecular chaperone GrpE
MATKRDRKSNHIPIRFVDGEDMENFDEQTVADMSGEDSKDFSPRQANRRENSSDESGEYELDIDEVPSLDALADVEDESSFEAGSNPKHGAAPPSPRRDTTSGPVIAELVATRAELRRVETDLQKKEEELEKATAEQKDAIERLARLQADFDNYRKRIERERGENYNAIVGEIVGKLLPVVDNLHRAISAENSASIESKDFRQFASGVRLIEKQLNEVLGSYGVEAIETTGHRFDPHIHEAIATEESDNFEPETVTEEIVRGYRLRDRLLRPAMVKVAK